MKRLSKKRVARYVHLPPSSYIEPLSTALIFYLRCQHRVECNSLPHVRTLTVLTTSEVNHD